MKLQVGDQYTNSVGNRITIKNIHNSGRRAELTCPNWKAECHNDVEDIVRFIERGYYTNYVSVSKYIPEIGDFVSWEALSGKSYEVWKVIGDTFWIIYNNRKDENQNYSINVQGLKKESTTNINKGWKKEDFLNTKIIVDTPEKSKRFQELLLTFGLQFLIRYNHTEKPYLYICKSGHMQYGSNRGEFDEEPNKEIHYESIFNNQSIINTDGNKDHKSNEETSTSSNESIRETRGTALSYSTERSTSNGKRYTGNPYEGRGTDYQAVRSEISFNAVHL